MRHACRKPLLIGRGRPRPGALRRRLALVGASRQRTAGGVLALTRASRERRAAAEPGTYTRAAAAHEVGRVPTPTCAPQVLQPLPETPLCSAVENLCDVASRQ